MNNGAPLCLMTIAMAAATPAIAASKNKEAIEALGTILAVEQVAAVMCTDIAVNQAAHTQYLQEISPAKAPTLRPKDNKAVDQAVEKHAKELQEDIKKIGLENWCKSSLELFGAKGFAFPILELKPKEALKPTGIISGVGASH